MEDSLCHKLPSEGFPLLPSKAALLLVHEQGSALQNFLCVKENQQQRISPGFRTRKVMETIKDNRDLLGTVFFAVHKHAKYCGGAQKTAVKQVRKVKNTDRLFSFSVFVVYNPFVQHTRLKRSNYALG